MARRKLPDNETVEDMAIRKQKERVSGLANRSEKVAWARKQNNMNVLIESLDQINEKVRLLKVECQPILQAIDNLRADMLADCIHPYDSLAYDHDTGTVICKFCNVRFAVPELVNSNDNDS